MRHCLTPLSTLQAMTWPPTSADRRCRSSRNRHLTELRWPSITFGNKRQNSQHIRAQRRHPEDAAPFLTLSIRVLSRSQTLTRPQSQPLQTHVALIFTHWTAAGCLNLYFTIRLCVWRFHTGGENVKIKLTWTQHFGFW